MQNLINHNFVITIYTFNLEFYAIDNIFQQGKHLIYSVNRSYDNASIFREIPIWINKNDLFDENDLYLN